MKRIITLITALSVVLSLHGFANAHGDAHSGAHETLMGTIATFTEAQILVTTGGEGDVSVKLSPSTRYAPMDEKKGEWRDLHEGMRVVIKFVGTERVAGEVSYRREDSITENGEDGHE
jgi:hypothetical protein